ncbi:MAG: hypothetical protein AB8B83_05150 [Bdellovibrionales bacterium]
MNFWLIIWLIFAVSLVLFFVWTFSILIAQKKAWADYAKKRKLRYRSQALMSGPELNGVMGDHTVGVFTSEHVSADARGSRKLTAIEVNLNTSMPIDGGIASGGMIPILKSLRFKNELFPKHKAWKKSYVASASHKGVLASYLTDERIEALCKLMEIPNSWVILVFKDDVILLRVDLADPLHNAKKLDHRIKTVLKAAKVCELSSGEQKRLKSDALKVEAQGIELDVDDSDLDAPVGLLLEDDEIVGDSSDEVEEAKPEPDKE